jgi:hypothetical protein
MADYEFKTLRDAGHPADPMVEYESFLQRELPDRVRHRLEVQIEDAWMPIEEALRGQIVDIVRDVQLELFQQFRSHKVRAKSDSGEGAANCGTDAIVVAAENDDALQLSEAEIAQEGLTQQQESCEEHVQAYRPEPYLDFPLDFFGELYNFEPLIKSFGAEDSTYGTISEADKGKQQETESGQSSRYYI